VRRYPIGGRLAVAPDGRHAALTQNSSFVGTPSSAIAILDLRSGRVRRLVGTVPDEWIQALAYSRDGRELIGPTFTATKVWDLASGRVVDTYPGIQRSGSNPGVVVDPRGLAIVMAGGGGISAWDPESAHRLARDFRLPEIAGLVVDPRGERMAVAQYDKRVGLYDLRTGRRVAMLPPAVGPITALAFLPDGRLAIGSDNGAVAIWDAAGRSVTQRLRFADGVHALTASPDGRLLAVQRQGAGADSHVEVRELATGRTRFTRTVRFGAGPLGLGALGFADGGRELVAAGCCVGGSVVTAFDPRTGAQRYSRTPKQPVTALATSAGSRTLLLGTEDGRMALWDARTGRALSAPTRVASTPVVQVALSPDRRLALVAARDGTVGLYDAATRKPVGDRFPITAGTIPLVLFEPNGRMLIVELTDAVEWPLDLPTLRRFACQVAGRGMTRAEWRDLFPARAFRPVCR
jgi:WD40 repeat protein